MEVFSDSKASQGAEMASIRIHPTYPLLGYRVVQDYRENSVLGGFSKIGGLWAFLGGAFATIFGSSILRTVLGMRFSLLLSSQELTGSYLGIKPLSVFGVMHSFQEKEIREACTVEYPRLMDDIKIPPTNRGLLSFVSNQLFELDFLGEEETQTREKKTPAQGDDIENRTDPDDDMVLLLQNMGDRDFSDSRDATLRH